MAGPDVAPLELTEGASPEVALTSELASPSELAPSDESVRGGLVGPPPDEVPSGEDEGSTSSLVADGLVVSEVSSSVAGCSVVVLDGDGVLDVGPGELFVDE